MTLQTRIVVAPDKFKGAMTAGRAAEAIRAGLLEACNGQYSTPEILLHPMADGGEGSMGLMERSLQRKGISYEKRFLQTINHLGEPILAPVIFYSEDCVTSAFVEMASICGLNMVSRDRRNLARSTTYGLGQVLRAVIEEHGARNVLLAIGGSGTNDGGFGLLTALGWSFSNSNPFRNANIPTFMQGITSASNASVSDICPHLAATRIVVASDVKSPLLGPMGATAVYGKQKGCRPDDAPLFESALTNWQRVLGQPDFSGAGAAGGCGYALKLLGAELKSGWDVFAALDGLEEDIASADLVITGEGRFDASSLAGKVPYGVAGLCRKHRKPLWLVVGRCTVGAEELDQAGICRVIELSAHESGSAAFADAPEVTRAMVSREFAEWLRG